MLKKINVKTKVTWSQKTKTLRINVSEDIFIDHWKQVVKKYKRWWRNNFIKKIIKQKNNSFHDYCDVLKFNQKFKFSFTTQMHGAVNNKNKETKPSMKLSFLTKYMLNTVVSCCTSTGFHLYLSFLNTNKCLLSFCFIFCKLMLQPFIRTSAGVTWPASTVNVAHLHMKKVYI